MMPEVSKARISERDESISWQRTRKRIRRESVGMEKTFCRIRAERMPSKG